LPLECDETRHDPLPAINSLPAASAWRGTLSRNRLSFINAALQRKDGATATPATALLQRVRQGRRLRRSRTGIPVWRGGMRCAPNYSAPACCCHACAARSVNTWLPSSSAAAPCLHFTFLFSASFYQEDGMASISPLSAGHAACSPTPRPFCSY